MQKKGFTLIELLVVIAIIGVLSSIVLVALRSARNKAKDARIIADMSQLRSLAEVLYDGTYDAIACSAFGTDCTCSNSDVERLCEDIYAQNSNAGFTIQHSGDKYCAYATLLVSKGGSTNYYCIDSTGVAKETTTNPAGSGYCTTSTFVCP